MFGSDRGASVTAMADAFASWLRRQGNIAGIISAGGSGGASLVAPAMRALPLAYRSHHLVRRLGDVGLMSAPPITMTYSVTDVQGLNSISRAVLANGANAVAGMVKARLDDQAKASETCPPICRRSASPCSGHDAGRTEDHSRCLRNEIECLVSTRPVWGGRSTEKLMEFRHAGRRRQSHHDGSSRTIP